MDPAAHRIRDRLWSGVLPNVEPLETWAGYSTGLLYCDGCDLIIGEQDVEHEVGLRDRRRLHFHVRCAALWQVLRMALPDVVEGEPRASDGTSPSVSQPGEHDRS
jgi:hypothetical protein